MNTVPEFYDKKETEDGTVHRTIRFPAVWVDKEQGLSVTLITGKSADPAAVIAIDRAIADIQIRAAALRP